MSITLATTHSWLRSWQRAAFAAAIAVLLSSAPASAQTAQLVPIAPLYFTMLALGQNPLPQILTLASTGAAIGYSSPAVRTAAGGQWLQVEACGNGTTPGSCEVAVNGVALPAGVYTGNIVFTGMTVPVTLTVENTAGPFFGSVVGGLSFIAAAGFTPAPQYIQLTNAGYGPLNWTDAVVTLQTTNAYAAQWLTLSATAGTAPSTVAVTASTAALGPGTYIAQILFQTASGNVTVPVSLTVPANGAAVFQQLAALDFTMPAGGPLPSSRIFTVMSTGAALSYSSALVQIAGGANWLSVTGCSDFSTPQACTASVTTTSLPPAVYTAQIVFTHSSTAMIVPVALTVGNPNAPTPVVSSGGIVPIDSVVNTIQPGEWVSIYGSGLAIATASWDGEFPTSLAATTVTIDGKPAYLWFVSQGQINLQAPDDTATGTVPVVVTTPYGSWTSTVTLAPFAPSFLLLDGRHVTGIIVRFDGTGAYGGGGYDIIGPTGTSLGYPTVAVKAGDIVELFCAGLGPTSPVVPAGQPFSGAAATTNPVTLMINGVPVTPAFAGLTGAGLYQLSVVIPAGLGAGDVSLAAAVGGDATPPGAVISLQ